MSNKKYPSQKITRELLENYQRRKFWYGQHDFLQYAEIFELEMSHSRINPGATILEIGFGEGTFLDWAKTLNFNITGLEINPDFVKMAKERGHNVYLGSPKEIFRSSINIFDLVVLFDVLEHLTLEEIVELFRSLKPLLKRQGEILARFPNGASPFGRFYQHADATHMTTLSGSKVSDIASLTGLKLESVHNSARPLRTGQRHWIFKKMAYLIRDLFQLLIGMVYFGKSLPMDANITVVITKEDSSEKFHNV